MLSLFKTKRSILKSNRVQQAELILKKATNAKNADKVSLRKEALSYITDEYWEIKNIGIKILGKVGGEGDVTVLCNLLGNKKEVGFVRRNSAISLREIGAGSKDVIEALLAAINDSYWETRAEAIRSIGELGEKDKMLESRILERLWGKRFDNSSGVNETYSPRFKEKNIEVKAAIAECLGKIGKSENSILSLKSLSNDDSWMIREKALAALVQVVDVDSEEFKQIISKIDLTCESFVPIFPLKELFNKVVKKE